jgi:hypothetical protein
MKTDPSLYVRGLRNPGADGAWAGGSSLRNCEAQRPIAADNLNFRSKFWQASDLRVKLRFRSIIAGMMRIGSA